MRKILLALVVAFTTAVCSAASYDEELLLGYWEVTQMDGYVSPRWQTFTGLYFGQVYQLYSDCMNGDSEDADSFRIWDGGKVNMSEDDSMEYGGYGFVENVVESGEGIFDVMFDTFSITSENKLHIDGMMQFKIEELTANSMKLVTYTSKKPCHITLRKTDKYSAVKSVAAEEGNEDTAAFDVEGRRVSENQKGLIISGSKGKYRKVFRK